MCNQSIQALKEQKDTLSSLLCSTHPNPTETQDSLLGQFEVRDCPLILLNLVGVVGWALLAEDPHGPLLRVKRHPGGQK